jgi:membrane-associated protease RseP (regulator of RpoE activity)
MKVKFSEGTMNTHTWKRTRYISLAAVLSLLAAGLWLAAPVLAGPSTQTPAVAPAAPVAPAASAAPAVAPAPVAAPAPWGVGYGYGEGEGSHTSYLGIDVRDITHESAQQLKLKEERGAEITMVDQDAPAGKAGLKEHDVILDFDGQRVEGVEQLRRMIHETPSGRNVTIGYSRDGQVSSMQVQLADRASAVAKAYVVPMPRVQVHMPHIEMPAIQIVTMSGSRAGLLVSNVTPQLGEYFGCKNGECVLVQSVEKGSAAESAGFKAGDVILKVDNERIADMSDWRSALRDHRSGGKVAITILRDRHEQTLSLTLPAGRDAGDAFQFEMPGVSLDMEAMEQGLQEAQHSMECAEGAVRTKMQAKLDEAELRKALERAQREYGRAMKQHGKQMEQLQREMKERQEQLQKRLEQMKEMNLDLDLDLE